MNAGRPSKLNEELIDNMYNKIASGLPVTYACDLFGITLASFNNWMKQGEEDWNEENYDSLYAQFFHHIKKAQADYVDNALTDIRSGRQGWQGAAWCLERTRKDFMPKQAIESNTEDGKVQVIFGGKVKDVKKEN